MSDLVQLIDALGSDLTVVNSARVSLHKESDYELVGPFGTEGDCRHAYSNDPRSRVGDEALWRGGTGWVYQRVKETDVGLINYCARERHFSPFTHCVVQFRIKMPLFLARQWYKHRVGIEKDCGWNEVSRRYVKDEPEFFLPHKGFRKAAEKVKQGSSDELVTEGFKGKPLRNLVAAHYEASKRLYLGMIDAGVAPEDARMVLPNAMFTEWIETGTIMAYARLVHLRSDGHAQSYIRNYANSVSALIAERFPISWKALMENPQ